MRGRFLVVGLLLVGCGAQPANKVMPTSTRSAAPLAPAPAASVAPEALARGETLLAGLRSAFTRCKGVEATVRSYSEGHYKAGAKVDELRKSTYVSKLLWVKPMKLRGDILETDNFLVGGASMATTDGKRVRVKGAGLLGILPITLDADSGLLASNRNYGFKQVAPDALMKRLTTPGATWRVIGTTQVKGTAVELVEVGNAPHLDPKVDREVIGIDPATFGLRGVFFYERGKKVADITFEKFRWDPRVSGDPFDL